MAHLPDAHPHPDADPHPDSDPQLDSGRPVLLPDGLGESALSQHGHPRRAGWRGLAGVLVAVVGAGVLVGGIIALAARVGVDGAATAPGSHESAEQTARASDDVDPAYAAVVADFTAFARGIDGVSDGDAGVLVEVVADADGGVPRGTADVLLDETGEGRMAAIATALTDWADEAQTAGRIELDLRLSTTDGAVDLSRPASTNAERLAVAAEVVQDDGVVGFWIGASRVDLVLVSGADREQGLEQWTGRVGEIAPAMAVTVRTADAD